MIFDTNAYCSGRETCDDNPNITAFPENFFTEALALGAEISHTASGFTTARYLFTDHDTFTDLPAMEEQAPILSVLAQIKNSPAEKTRLLKVNGPYSILAALVEPALFCRRIAKNPEVLHYGLEKITSGLAAYIHKAFALGVEIISLADPYANAEILGERRYKEFAGSYLIKLLKGIIADENSESDSDKKKHIHRIIHLCPYNSLSLEKFGMIKSETQELENTNESYLDLLRKTKGPAHIRILGHQCIYIKQTTKIIKLSF
ncbi:MAG: uroporphyrinogen decarboxylase family protein [Treponema sp.]|jgi:uroporphyrinogen-III decarboxylase|nr:uroporphyrinogen decarboxylase family protein [Treponema sp.]